MRQNNYLYLIDNKILFWNNEKIYEQDIPNKIVQNGKIIHRPRFQVEFQNFLKKNKIIKKFQNNILIIITPPNFEEVDKEIFKLIFEDSKFSEIKFLKELNLYKIKKNECWINKNEEYSFIAFKRKEYINSFLIPNYFFAWNFYEIIKQSLKDYPKCKKIILIGTDKNIPNIVDSLEEYVKVKTLFYENYYNYLIDMTKKYNF